MSEDSSSGASRKLTAQLRDLSAFQAFTASLGQDRSEQDIAKLVASSLPSVWGDILGAVGLRSIKAKAGWEFYGHIDGVPLDAGMSKNLQAIFTAVDAASSPGTTTVLGTKLPLALRKRKLQALHLLPVRTLENQLGALLLGTRDAEPLSPERKIFLSSLANHLAMALTNARLRRDLRDQNLLLEDAVRARTAELQSLLEIAQAVSAHLDRDQLFRAVGQAVESLVSFDRMVIVLPHSREDLIVYAFETKKGDHSLPLGATLPRVGSLPGWVLKHKKPFIGSSLVDVRQFPVSLDILSQKGMQSSCALPLLVVDRVVGVLVFHGKDQAVFNPVKLPLFEKLSAVVALALDNCLAYEQIRQLTDQLTRENVYLREEIKTEHRFHEIVGRSRPLKKVLKRIELVAPTDSSILITGETGTGKELIARAIHHLSKRQKRPLIKVNCAALPAGLIESELFGHEKGAFTGALTRKIGRFELAHQGTIFLDEIGDLPQEIQIKLLRVLQEYEFERVGSTETIKVDVRLITATNRDLVKAVEEGRYRADLYYRLNVFPVHLPSLREREDDIPLLVQYFVDKYATKIGKPIDTVSQETIKKLKSYTWPGNIRELENVIERSVILSSGSVLEVEDEFLVPSSSSLDQEGKEILTLQELDRDHITRILNQTRWVIEGPRGAARILDLHPNTLRSRIKKLGIERADERAIRDSRDL